MAKKKKGAKKTKNRVKKVVKKAKRIKKIERIATGIKNFDGFIEGGFEKNSTNLIVGGSGSGKSEITQRARRCFQHNR